MTAWLFSSISWDFCNRLAQAENASCELWVWMWVEITCCTNNICHVTLEMYEKYIEQVPYVTFEWKGIRAVQYSTDNYPILFYIIWVIFCKICLLRVKQKSHTLLCTRIRSPEGGKNYAKWPIRNCLLGPSPVTWPMLRREPKDEEGRLLVSFKADCLVVWWLIPPCPDTVRKLFVLNIAAGVAAVDMLDRRGLEFASLFSSLGRPTLLISLPPKGDVIT